MLNEATVIIPCFNVGSYITECLDSVKEQAYVYHTIVVDNNSHDETISKVQAWQRKNASFPLTLVHEKKQGAPAARNAALSLVETKWIQFLDADDLLLPNKIADQIKLHPNADVICAGAIRRSIDRPDYSNIPENNIPLSLIRGTAGNTCSNLFSTASIQSIHGWDETLKSSQEYDLMFRLWKARASFSVDSVPRAIIRQRVQGQISTSHLSENLTRYIQLREQMLEEFRIKKIFNSHEINVCHQQIFDRLRQLAISDLPLAVEFHDRIFPFTFQPIANGSNSRIYTCVYQIFGFEKAEKIKRWREILLRK